MAKVKITIEGLESVEHALVQILNRLGNLEEKVDVLMSQADDLRAAQAEVVTALGGLADTISTEAAQVAQALADLVAATGNQVTDADVAAAVNSVSAITAAADAIKNFVPDAPVEPPA